jgi:hypothetical protein
MGLPARPQFWGYHDAKTVKVKGKENCSVYVCRGTQTLKRLLNDADFDVTMSL